MFRERPKGGYTLVGTWEFAEYSFVSTTMDNSVLTYIVNHVFMPPVLPQEDDRDISNDAALCHAVLDCARRYQLHLLDDGPQAAETGSHYQDASELRGNTQ